MSTIYCIINKKGDVIRWAKTEEEAKAITAKKAKWGWTHKAIVKENRPAEVWELAGELSDPNKTNYNGDKLDIE